MAYRRWHVGKMPYGGMVFLEAEGPLCYSETALRYFTALINSQSLAGRNSFCVAFNFRRDSKLLQNFKITSETGIAPLRFFEQMMEGGG